MATEKRLIDADALLDSLGASDRDIYCKEIIEEAPTVDAVEVVRCKECKKREICRTTTIWAVAPGDDWYCADGERKNK